MVGKLLFLFLLFAPLSVFGQTEKSVVINEIAWMGSMADGVDPKQYWRYEWLELHNSLDVPVGLDGWAIELSRDKPDFKISLKGSIDPKGYFLMGASDKVKNIDLNYKNLAGKFNNSGQRVVLKNSAGGVVDEIDATKGWSAGENDSKRTMERVAGSDPATWQTSKDSGGTPKAQNSNGVALKPSFNNEKLGFSSETKKDPTRSSLDKLGTSPFSTAVPVALLAGALALGARRFLYPEQRRRVG